MNTYTHIRLTLNTRKLFKINVWWHSFTIPFSQLIQFCGKWLFVLKFRSGTSKLDMPLSNHRSAQLVLSCNLQHKTKDIFNISGITLPHDEDVTMFHCPSLAQLHWCDTAFLHLSRHRALNTEEQNNAHEERRKKQVSSSYFTQDNYLHGSYHQNISSLSSKTQALSHKTGRTRGQHL